MSRRRSTIALALGAALLAVPLVVGPASAQSEHDRILAYWTAARMASAKPRDVVPVGAPASPNARPGGGGGGGGGGTSAVVGASWTKGGAIVTLTGKVYFSMDGGNWQCSGSVINDQGRSDYSLVLTAGHCTVSETTGQFATNWVFIPSWDTKPASFSTACNNNTTQYGCWTAVALVARSEFASAGGFNDQAIVHDWGFAVVGSGGYNNTQLDALGSLGIQFSNVASGDRLAAFGYPAAGKYHGNDLTYCAGNIFTDSLANNATWGMACDMTGGSSGGPWVKGLNESNGSGGTVSSLNSYGYSGIKNMYGPKFNSETQATYDKARTVTTNTLVP
jgi:hypothetical protein